ncbi:MAG: cytidylate kinase [Firmicutes bacterium HGW-Firmicutes-1]|jgi:cytidylate kinase|nr:MAG: cytidylate kinase [Firmicutes bacterium HGW-Firmicutes-1]
MKTFSIAIDGPAGAGKSTIARMVSKKLNYIYVDTGAMYRAFGLYCLENNIPLSEDSISSIVDDVDITIEYDDDEQQVILNGRNVNVFIRSSEASHMASAISVYKSVRLKLVDLQRKLAENANVVMDGRDIGTYVLPNASLKIYLNASVAVRADRRCKELHERGIDTEVDLIKEEIIDRDTRDMNREFAPLRKAHDAIELDTSTMNISQVTEKIVMLFEEKEK